MCAKFIDGQTNRRRAYCDEKTSHQSSNELTLTHLLISLPHRKFWINWVDVNFVNFVLTSNF